MATYTNKFKSYLNKQILKFHTISLQIIKDMKLSMKLSRKRNNSKSESFVKII